MTSFWVSNPNNLNLMKFSTDSTESTMNSVTVIVIYTAIAMAVILKTYTPLYLGTLGVAGVAMLYYFKYSNSEHMGNLREPTLNNPLMNVNPTDYDKPQEYKDYHRYKEVSQPTPQTERIQQKVENDFIGNLFQDPNSKLWERQNSQRQFISQPVGGVPNRQNEFANWLYGKSEICKGGSIWDKYGVQSTPDSLVCTGFNNGDGPTNGGIKEKY